MDEEEERKALEAFKKDFMSEQEGLLPDTQNYVEDDSLDLLD